MKKNAWTSEQIERLEQLAAAGASPFRIGAAVKKAPTTVLKKANELGIKVQNLRTLTEK